MLFYLFIYLFIYLLDLYFDLITFLHARPLLAKEQESLMRYTLMPFSLGPRICIGNKLAMAEMRLVLASLLQKFNFSLVPGFPEVT